MALLRLLDGGFQFFSGDFVSCEIFNLFFHVDYFVVPEAEGVRCIFDSWDVHPPDGFEVTEDFSHLRHAIARVNAD